MDQKRVLQPETGRSWRLLFFSPVGRAAAPLLGATLARFATAGADFLLVQYDDADLALPPQIPVRRDSGGKWQLARRHLPPEVCADYDAIFVWDDDLGIADFDPAAFVAIMQENGLLMAQPSIRSPHFIQHGVTRQQAIDPALRAVGIVGRLTNFVEIMAPVFTPEGWRQLHEVLDDGNLSGWGYDYVPIAPRGVVDSMHVVHTRPIQSHSEKARAEQAHTLATCGLFAYPLIDMGWLFAPPPPGVEKLPSLEL